MLRKRVGLALLVVLIAAVLGATVLREPIAYAASPFTNVIVGNTTDSPVPVAQQGTAKVDITNTSLSVTQQPTTKYFNFTVDTVGRPGPPTSFAFPDGPIDASLVTITGGNGLSAQGTLWFKNGETFVLAFELPMADVAVPLPQTARMDHIEYSCSTTCHIGINVVGR